jgi:hypothetical protein
VTALRKSLVITSVHFRSTMQKPRAKRREAESWLFSSF